MSMAQIVARLRGEHRRCCLTTNCRERDCFIGLSGLDGNAMAILHGGRFQNAHGWRSRLGDRIIISSEFDGFVAIVELKSGRSTPKLNPVLDQISGGLEIAQQLLREVTALPGYPILAYSGHVGPTFGTALRAKKNLVRFQGRDHQVIKRDCNTELAEVVRIDV